MAVMKKVESRYESLPAPDACGLEDEAGQPDHACPDGLPETQREPASVVGAGAQPSLVFHPELLRAAGE